MSTSDIPNFPSSRSVPPSGRLNSVAEDAFGASAVSLFMAAEGFLRWVIHSDFWIVFFLVSKPLIDLTWRLEFFNIFNQRVNPQAIVGALIAVLNLVAGYFCFRKVRYARRVLLFLAMATVSVIITPTSEGLNELVRLLSGVSFVFTAGLAISTKQKFEQFARWLLAVLCVPLVLSCLQVAGALPFDYWDWINNQEVGRASGTYQHPLEVVFFLVYAIPLALYRWENSKKGGAERVFLAIFFLLAFFGLAFTFHRAGWVAICVEMGIWYTWKRRLKRVLLGVLAIVVLTMAISDQVVLVYQPADIIPDQADLESGHFMRGRGANWILFLASYASGGPIGWLVGKGGSVADVGSETIIAGSEDEPHNDFIRILHAYGLVGLFLYLSLLVGFLREGFRARVSENLFFRNIGAMVVCCVIGILLLSVTAEPMRYPTAVWYLFAMGSALLWERNGGLSPATVRVLPEA